MNRLSCACLTIIFSLLIFSVDSVDIEPVQKDSDHTNHEQMNVIIDSLIHQSEQLQNILILTKKKRKTKTETSHFLNDHQLFLVDIIDKLRNMNQMKSNAVSFPHSSTPYRNNDRRLRLMGSPLSASG